MSLAKKPAECATSSFQNVMKCDVDHMFHEIGECMTTETDGILVYSHVLLCLQFLFGTPSEPLYFFLVTVGLRHLSITAPCSHVSCPRKKDSTRPDSTVSSTTRRSRVALSLCHSWVAWEASSSPLCEIESCGALVKLGGLHQDGQGQTPHCG